jgi:hypothetical protein
MELLRWLSTGMLDLATAFLFAATWYRPDWLGQHWVKSLMLVMLVEFLVVHSFGFLFVATEEGGAKSVAMLFGFGAFYLLFAAAFAAAFKSWWPVWMFGWLITSKLWALLTGAVDSAAQQSYVTSVWVVSVLAYLLGCFITVLVPLPRLGVDKHGHAYGIAKDASGVWVEQPHRVLAFGLLYFTCLGVARIALAPVSAG